MAVNQTGTEIIQDTVSKPFCRLDLAALFKENSSHFTGEGQAGSLSTRACRHSCSSGENDTRLFFLAWSNSYPQAEINNG